MPLHYLPAAYSTLAADGLSRLVAEQYGLSDPQAVLVRRGFNDNYRITAGRQRYILRVYLHNKYYVSGPDDLRFELDLLDHLEHAGVRVATAVPRQSGDKLGTLQAPEGHRHYALFRYAPGTAVRLPNHEHTRALGAALARVHLAADSFESAYPRHSLDLRALIDAPLQRLAPYLVKRPADLEYLQTTADEIRTRLTALPVPPGGWGIVHGDPHTGNCRFTGRHVALFDFDTCGYGWRAYDVAIFMGEGQYHHRPAFLAAYQSVRPLSAAEVGELRTFAKGRAIWDAGDILMLAHIWGESMMTQTVDNLLQELPRIDGDEVLTLMP